ncbi:GPW/gp25 family protein [Sulfitobacter sp.]|uniref:GPW/gp25 family protein n=1 Tax=Sulfitobacter sp. TaxID=1903071 RepID=UPI0025E34CD0|nr:GPW/gp25 family protein [Sulfitobacter sp.]
MNASTGAPLDGIDHLRQSITDILTTPIGSRVMRRDYGSRLYDLVDAPINRSTVLDAYTAVAEALNRWEPRIRLEQVQMTDVAPGRMELSLSAILLSDGREITLDGVVVQ